MANLISPGVSVSVVDESFYIAGRQTTLPIFFVATKDEKKQIDGITPAIGTYESGVLRVVTSAKQALELYGVPSYLVSADGVAHHGDVRNEYGLDALLKFLEVGNRAYVVRANVNLDDSYANVKNMWTAKVAEASDLLAELVDDYIAAYNTANGLLPLDVAYKESVTKAELTELIDEAMASVFASYSFSSDLFTNNFLRDHTVAQAGYQDVLFETGGGFIQLSDVTGYVPAQTYNATVRVVSGSGTSTTNLAILGSNATTFGQLVDVLNAAFGATADVELISGRLRIKSTLAGVTSSVTILSDGDSGLEPVFGALNLYKSLAVPVVGTGTTPLVVYDDAFATVLGGYEGVDSIVDSWSTGSVVSTEFNATEAAALLVAAAADYDNTREYKDETSLGSNDAQRRVEIVAALAEAINNPYSGIRAENLEYNIVAAPGFPELTDELLRLSSDMLDEVFVVGETPFDKPPVGPNGIDAWATTPAKASDYKVAYASPHGISSNIDGVDILTTAAATMIRTFAYNDSVADVWYAAAGTRRGTCPHLKTIGYVSGALGGPTTFVEDLVDLGSRDSLQEFPKNINPISFISGRGILMMGQKTTSPVTSALDRINVSRLVMFIKRELRKSTFSYLFEPNDQQTRNQVKFTVDGFLSGLMGRRALYDFASVCDASNNDDARVDASELWIDVAIKPVKAVEYILIPLRIVNTGTNIGTGR